MQYVCCYNSIYKSIVMVVNAMAGCVTVSRIVGTHLNKENYATKAEFFIVLHNHDCRELTSPSQL